MTDKSYTLPKSAHAALVSIVSSHFDYHSNKLETQYSLDELAQLLKTIDVTAGPSFIQEKQQPDAGTVLGSGKIAEIAEAAKMAKCDFLVFDFPLTASQLRNIEKLTKMKVVDRCHVIFQIFAQHAKTKESQIQIEISRLQYLLPRLTSLWTHFSKLKGGIGLKGEGEQQLELDRRIVNRKISQYKNQLAELKKAKSVQSKERLKKTLNVALLGYTNAGKSSLMNRLCQAAVLEEDKLFATLDSTYRLLSPDTRPPIVLADTVGFISNLPSVMVEGFKTTLQSAHDADMLVLVVDISDPHMDKQISVTQKTLEELDLHHKKSMFVFTKKDKLANPMMASIKMRPYPSSYLVSSFNHQDMLKLRDFIMEELLKNQEHYDLFIPYEDGQSHAKIKKNTNILKIGNHEKGIFYRVRSLDHVFHKLSLQHYVLNPAETENFLKFFT
ncbi:MAG: GTPase HflX [Bacteriovoracaceae bacterium]|nr:GTPase HflX [Bacteriovoracaceae bacterium]